MNINNFKNYLLYPQWGKLRNGLHIIDGSRGEITMDQLFDRFTEKDFVTPQNLNDKVRQFYLLLSCNLSMRLLTYTDLLNCKWTECKKLAHKGKCSYKNIVGDFMSLTNFIVDWPSGFQVFSKLTKLKFKKYLNSYISIVDDLASFYHSDKYIDNKISELYSNIRTFMKKKCRPIQPIPSDTIQWYNKSVENGMSPTKIKRKIKFLLIDEQLNLLVLFWKLGFLSTPKTFEG
ncbi:uncharacterized protein LOC126895288 isoform X2 [Daktulosphaira vitifoliae]|nr:uncharacterized protein LOC126895288 isoform X2 [Daktulosphaira vitifoliae]XP_050522960.1 uncharacterized protein LOC126895288 isoform X2 [Daktulosphaira vitifoliae]XP_050522961.1 uncharacterized protein LOC126895288 isoform X2 [Daktulosphaira vitifoliae]